VRFDKDIAKTRLPSHLRQTTRECVYFRSRDKDGGHNIQSATAENPALPHNVRLYLLYNYQSYCCLHFHNAGLGNFAFLASVTLTLTR